VITEAKGKRIGVIGAADARSKPSGESSAGTFPADLKTIESVIHDLRKRVDIVIVTVHAGTEFVSAPSPFQMAFAGACQQAGADIIQYHHAHRISGVAREEKCLILYGTGNYIFPYVLPRGFNAWYRSAAWIADVNIDDGVVSREVRPVTIDGKGIPRPSSQREEQYILELVDRYSRRIESQQFLGSWRAREVLNPVFIRLAIANYGSMLKANGIRATMKTIINGFVHQFKTD
jgi:poly-gamma-glutamate synthesis protein (capsule biosynthesis protein)